MRVLDLETRRLLLQARRAHPLERAEYLRQAAQRIGLMKVEQEALAMALAELGAQHARAVACLP
jgi:anti-sigma regulatory factor (Ser/Thr protein kinase)